MNSQNSTQSLAANNKRSFWKFFIKVGYRYSLKALWHSFVVSRSFNPTSPEYIVALLHDAIEDKYATMKELKELFSLSEGEEAALDAITRDSNTTYMEYIKVVSDNLTALVVKLVDLTHNIKRCGKKLFYSSLKKRYQKAYSFLKNCKELKNGK